MSVLFIADNLDEVANREIIKSISSYGERSGLGFRIWYYENEDRKSVAFDAANKVDGISVLMPIKYKK